MTPAQAIIQAIGDAPERAYAAGESAVRALVTEWATRALLAESDLSEARALTDRVEQVAERLASTLKRHTEERDEARQEVVTLRARIADVEAELRDFRAVARGRT